MDKMPTRDQLAAKMKELATPIDFGDLERRRILVKKGGWYLVLDRNALPPHVWAQATAVSDGPRLKLPKSWTRAQNAYRRFTGKDFDE